MIPDRCRLIKPFMVMEVLEKAQAMAQKGIDVIHLEVGEPDFDTPECIKQAAVKAMKDGQTHYTHSLGIFELRQAVCEHYHDRYGVTISPDRVLVTSGTSPAMFMVFSALLNKGDRVIISDPGYACYPSFICFAGGLADPVRVYEEDGFQYRVSAIREKLGPKTRAVMINSPSNPTGNLLSDRRMSQVADLGPYVLSDEIYHGLVYEGRQRSILEFTDRAFVFNGFSKLYAMTGWRLGYVIAPEKFMRTLQVMHQNFFISANAMAQWAGLAALKQAGPDVARMRDIYNQRRVFMIKRLKEIGFGITVEPTGAFYVLANAEKFGRDSFKLAFDILENAHVGVTPGVDFGPGAEGYLRFSYANSLDNIAEGMNRLEAYLKA